MMTAHTAPFRKLRNRFGEGCNQLKSCCRTILVRLPGESRPIGHRARGARGRDVLKAKGLERIHSAHIDTLSIDLRDGYLERVYAEI